MKLTIDYRGEAVHVELGASFIDGSNVPFFKGRITPILQETSCLILDMTNIKFIDSVGISALLWCQRQLFEQGSELKLCGLTPRVKMILELLRLERIFVIYIDADQALLEVTQRQNGVLRRA